MTQFSNLMVRQRSLIVGPRGSGKTTLLRMLHPECLTIWEHPEADLCRSQIDFSVFTCATDHVWKDQVEAASEGASEDVRLDFFQTIVAIDAMAAILRTIEIGLAYEDGVRNRRFSRHSSSTGAEFKVGD